MSAILCQLARLCQFVFAIAQTSTCLAPASINNFANAFTVAPVVTTSSTIASVLFVTPEYCVDKFPDVALGVTLEE